MIIRNVPVSFQLTLCYYSPGGASLHACNGESLIKLTQINYVRLDIDLAVPILFE